MAPSSVHVKPGQLHVKFATGALLGVVIPEKSSRLTDPVPGLVTRPTVAADERSKNELSQGQLRFGLRVGLIPPSRAFFFNSGSSLSLDPTFGLAVTSAPFPP